MQLSLRPEDKLLYTQVSKAIHCKFELSYKSFMQHFIEQHLDKRTPDVIVYKPISSTYKNTVKQP